MKFLLNLQMIHLKFKSTLDCSNLLLSSKMMITKELLLDNSLEMESKLDTIKIKDIYSSFIIMNQDLLVQ